MTMTLQVAGLTKVYGRHRAVSDLSFTAQAGDIVGFVGPNGAGKTTTIRILSTVLEPTSGEFWIEGIPGHRPDEIRRRIGVLPESAGYAGSWTGREYLTFFARLFGMGRVAAGWRAGEVLTEFGLSSRAEWPISAYSRGMRQRLGIARAVVNDPAVVFLDEPTLGLDPAGQQQVLALVRGLAEDRGATIVLSTHSLPVVEQICTSVVLLDRGRVARAGSVTEVSRAAGARQTLRLRVPAQQAGQAHQVLAALGRDDIEIVGDRSGLLDISVPGQDDTAPAAGDPGQAVLRAVLDAGITIQSFEAGTSGLSDVFLSITAASRT